MKKFIYLFLALLLSSPGSWAALPDDVASREYQKFVADAAGDTAIRVIAPDGVATAGGWTDTGTSIKTTTLTDNVGIGTITPGGLLQVDNNFRVANDGVVRSGLNIDGTASLAWITSWDTAGGNRVIAGSLTADDLSIVTGGTSAGQEKVRIQNSSGNVGINTIDPRGKFEVLGSSPYSIVSNTSGTASHFTASAITNQSALYYGPGSLTIDSQVYANRGTTVGGSTRVALLSGGNLGVGTLIPAAKLEVQQTSDSAVTTGAINFGVTSAGATGELTSSSGTQTFAQIKPVYNQTSTAGGTDLLIGRTETAIGSGTHNFVDMQIGSTSKFRVDRLGNTFFDIPAAETIAAAATITADACGSIKLISSAGAVTTNTTNTFTAPAAANEGCVMHVCNSGSNNITLDNNANFKSAGAADVVMTADDCVIVGSTGASGVWYQITALEAN